MASVKVGSCKIGEKGRPFFAAGPCVIESETHCLKMAERLAAYAEQPASDGFIFKASYDKGEPYIPSNRLSRARVCRKDCAFSKKPAPFSGLAVSQRRA